MSVTTTYNATPTAADFHNDPGNIRVLAGAIGSGKSVACVFELVAWAFEQEPDREGVRKTRFAIVRNTVDQLKNTTMKTIFDWLPPGVWGEHRIVDKTFTIRQALGDGTRIESEWLFLSLDNPADTRKALSLELTGVWLNEAREIHPEVIEVMPTRTGRYPRHDARTGTHCTRSGMIMDTNFMPADSWFGQRLQMPESAGWSVFIQPPAAIAPKEYVAEYGEDPPATYKDFDGREWAVNPRAENLANLKEDYYAKAIQGKSRDFVDTFILCRFGRELGGKPVYEGSFVRSFHVLESGPEATIKPVLSSEYPVVIGLDFGRTPSAVFMQSDPRGRITLFSEVHATNCGIERFITEYLKPHIREHYVRCDFVVAPDPSGYFRQQIGELSLVDIVKKAGFKVTPPPSNDPSKRIEVVERALMRQVDGKAALRIHPHCKKLIRGFEDGYRYRLKRNGELEDKPDKNHYSHLHDACQYGLSVLEIGPGRGWGVAKAQDVEVVSAAGWV